MADKVAPTLPPLGLRSTVAPSTTGPRYFAGGSDSSPPWHATLVPSPRSSADWPGSMTHMYRRHAQTTLANVAITASRAAEAEPFLDYLGAVQGRVDRAAFLLSCAFAEAGVRDFKPRSTAPAYASDQGGWFEAVFSDCVGRVGQVRDALLHAWTPTPEADSMAIHAFWILSELTPSQPLLLRMLETEPRRATHELARHLDLVREHLLLSAELFPGAAARPSDDERLAEATAELLDMTGGAWSLTEAARALGVTRQAVHKRIQSGSVLAMMRDGEIVVPRGQFVVSGEATKPAPQLAKISQLFEQSRAGPWAALQFLTEVDPVLGKTPLQALADGEADAATAAARAHLGLEEG